MEGKTGGESFRVKRRSSCMKIYAVQLLFVFLLYYDEKNIFAVIKKIFPSGIKRLFSDDEKCFPERRLSESNLLSKEVEVWRKQESL